MLGVLPNTVKIPVNGYNKLYLNEGDYIMSTRHLKCKLSLRKTIQLYSPIVLPLFVLFMTCLPATSNAAIPKDDIYNPAPEGTFNVPQELKNFRVTASEPLKVTNAKEFGKYPATWWQSDPSRVIFHNGEYHFWVINKPEAKLHYRTEAAVKKHPRPKDGLSGILYMKSKDTYNWQAVSFVPLGPVGSSYDYDLEQANVVYHKGKFYLFSEGHTTNVKKYGQVCAGMVCLEADDPAGPWRQVGGDHVLHPSLDGTSFDTDAVPNPCHVFLNGKWLMYYKGTKKVTTRNGVAFADNLIGPYTKSELNPLLVGHGHFAWRYKHGIIMLMFDAWWEDNRARILWTEDGVHFVPLAEKEGTFLWGSFYLPNDPTCGEPVTNTQPRKYWGIVSDCSRRDKGEWWNLERFEWQFGADEKKCATGRGLPMAAP